MMPDFKKWKEQNVSIEMLPINEDDVNQFAVDYSNRIKNNILNRIKNHNKEISAHRKVIEKNITDSFTLKLYTELIRSEEISIRECNMILENCF